LRGFWVVLVDAREALRRAEELLERALGGGCGDSLCEAVRELYGAFPRRSWLARSIARLLLGTVRPSRVPGLWYVDGVRELGDWRATYTVEYVGGEAGYRCSCYSTTFGYVRRSRVCTHVGAVMLYRRQLKLGERA